MIKDHLIADWKQAHRFLSVQIAGLGALLTGVWSQVPDDIKNHFPSWLVSVFSAAILLSIIAARVTKKPSDDS